jgi:ADP-ribose pyrophosphatase
MSEPEGFPKLLPDGEHRVYETPWQDFYYDDIVHPNGESGKYAWIKSHSGNGAVMTIPVTPSEKYLMIKVYRHPSKRYLWEFPAGLIEDGESPEESGRRELIEETGITPVNMEFLGSHIPIGGLSGEAFYAVLAEIPEISTDDIQVQTEEGIVEARLFSRKELIDFIQNEEVSEGLTLACIARYWMFQETRKSD